MTPQLQAYIDENFVDWIAPNPIQVLVIPEHYKDPEGHRQATEWLERDSATAYAFALYYRLTGEQKYRDRALWHINAWATTLAFVNGKEAKLVLAYKAQRFIMAGMLLNLKAEERYPLLRFIGSVYLPVCKILEQHWNNWGAWGYAGHIVSAAFTSKLVPQDVIDATQQHLRFALKSWIPRYGKQGHFWMENARVKYGLKYGFFALEAYFLAAIMSGSPALMTDVLEVMTTYWRYVINPDSFVWKDRAIPGKWFFPSGDEFLIPKSNSWPANIYYIAGVITQNDAWTSFASEDVCTDVNALRYPKSLMEVWNGLV